MHRLRIDYQTNGPQHRRHQAQRQPERPVHDDRKLYEFLILEGAQAGLSWEIILNKREGYRSAFSGFDAAKVARYDDRKREQLLQNAGIVRNRLKIAAAIQNAKSFLATSKEFGTFDRYVWKFALVSKARKRGQGVPTHSTIRAMTKTWPVAFPFVGTNIVMPSCKRRAVTTTTIGISYGTC